jgi:hypothetical protein
MSLLTNEEELGPVETRGGMQTELPVTRPKLHQQYKLCNSQYITPRIKLHFRVTLYVSRWCVCGVVKSV